MCDGQLPRKTRPEGHDPERRQDEDPHVFLCGKTPVRVTFQSDGESLERRLEAYFAGRKGRA